LETPRYGYDNILVTSEIEITYKIYFNLVSQPGNLRLELGNCGWR